MVFDGDIGEGEAGFPRLLACGMDKVKRWFFGFSNSSMRACRIEICSMRICFIPIFIGNNDFLTFEHLTV